jgi:hypothetical protein
MLKKQTISYLFLAVGLGFFLYSCDSDEPQAPAQNEKPPQTISEPETSQNADSDPEKARKIEELIRKLEGSDKRAAYDAALQLALIGDETAVDPLIDVYKRERGMMRVAAIKALGSIGDKRALDVLLEALKDGDVNIRRNAASGLGNLGDESAIEPLIEALKDQDDWVRMGAIGSLKKITRQDLPDYDAWSEWYQGR